MATVTKTITETGGSAPTKSAWTLSYTHADVVVSGSTFTFGPPTMTAKYVNSARSYAKVTSNLFLDSTFPKSRPYDYYTCFQDAIAWASNVTKAIPLTYSEQNTYNTSDFFTSNNASSKEVPIHIIDRQTWGESRQEDTLYGEFNFGAVDKDWGTLFNVVLNVPPTATLGTPTYATPQYAGLGAYTVPITSAEAYYGGNIAKVTLKVGQDSTVQTYSSASISNETISVTPTMAGTYTPTITVEDSRGQTTTNTLPQIVVNPYLDPSLDFDVFRSNSSGVRDDEGAYGLITANVSFTDAIADLVQPTVKINGTTTNNVTWYSAYSGSTGVSSAISDWSTISSGDTIYGLINGSFSQTDSYQITVVLTDSLGGNSSAITQTLSTAFYTIDFQAGGKEIAFGGPANDTLTTNQEDVGLFKCNMEAQFNEDAVFNADLTAQDMTSQEVQDFVDDVEAQTTVTPDSSEAITQNDLLNILNEVLPPQPQGVEARTLLWTNPSPNASFTAKDVTLSGVYDAYDYIEVDYVTTYSESVATGQHYIEKTPCHNGTTAICIGWVSASSRWEIWHRARWWNSGHTAIHFDSAYWNALSTASGTGQSDANMIPYKIYGIKVL